MCGRFAIFSKPEDYLEQAGLDADLAPCEAVEYYNAYPTQDLPVVYHDPSKGLSCGLLHWGLIPSWAKDKSFGFKTANARSETAAEKPSFKKAFYQHRCLVPMDGWFEWLRKDKVKQPYFHHREDNRVIWVAGLWDHWIDPVDQKLLISFSILTRDAVGKPKDIHNRMPLVLDQKDFNEWLDPKQQDRTSIEALMHQEPEEDFDIYPVTMKMNSPKFSNADCIVPTEAATVD